MDLNMRRSFLVKSNTCYLSLSVFLEVQPPNTCLLHSANQYEYNGLRYHVCKKQLPTIPRFNIFGVGVVWSL